MNFKTTFFVASFLIWTLTGTCQSISVMTFNIRYDEPRDLENSWSNRRADMIEMLKKYHPAFLGIQEGLAHQVAYIDSSMEEYKYIGVGRDDGKTGGEYSAIFYDASVYECIESTTFWLSETPDTISFGWDATFRRICTYGLFMHKATRERLWVFNAHFDHIAVVARRNSALLILEKIGQLTAASRFPVILMGDFNVTPEEEPVQIITKQLSDGLNISSSPLHGPKGTWNAFVKDADIHRRIDYVFVRDLRVLDYRHIDDRTEDNRWISDHLPVLVTINLNAGDK